jgi:hypothetical protein
MRATYAGCCVSRVDIFNFHPPHHPHYSNLSICAHQRDNLRHTRAVCGLMASFCYQSELHSSCTLLFLLYSGPIAMSEPAGSGHGAAICGYIPWPAASVLGDRMLGMPYLRPWATLSIPELRTVDLKNRHYLSGGSKG